MAQPAKPRDPIAAIVKLFETHRIVILGELHDCRQQHELLHRLVAAPEFAGRVNDIVLEACSARFQGVGDDVDQHHVHRPIRQMIEGIQ